MQYDILIKNCNIITMDKKSRILNEYCLGINKDKIVYIGEYNDNLKGKEEIDGKDFVLMPGLIDSHAHAGHGLLKTVGEGILDEDVLDLYEHVYYRCSTTDFWYIEARLSAIEKIKFGITTGMSYLGSHPRYDSMDYADAHVLGVRESGIRDILGMGTPNPPFPKTFKQYKKDGTYLTKVLKMEDSFEITYEAVKKYNDTYNSLTYCYPTPSYIGKKDGMTLEDLKKQNREMKKIATEFGTPIHAHAYKGDVKFAYKHLDILGSNVSLAHVTGVDEEEIKILADTGTSVCSGPFTVAYIESRCPVIEMLQEGVNVTFCSDASAPNRSYDLFEKMRIGTILHRAHFNNNNLLPPGKVLQMVTIDAAKALGLDKLIGSIEIGKKADIILIDMKKPHLYPRWHDPIRLVYEALGSDVNTVIVNGKIVMKNREVLTMNEDTVLEDAQKCALSTLKTANAMKYIKMPEDLFNSISYENICKLDIDNDEINIK